MEKTLWLTAAQRLAARLAPALLAALALAAVDIGLLDARLGDLVARAVSAGQSELFLRPHSPTPSQVRFH